MTPIDTATGTLETSLREQAPTTLPLRAKLLFSVSGIGSEALIQSKAAWLLYFYAPPADSGLKLLLPLGLFSVLRVVLAVTDSLDEAIIGYWSDRTRSRLGRRLPFILAGTPLWALFAVLVVFPPTNVPTALTAVYFAVMMQLYGIFSTIAGAPYEALMPEIARTSDDRIKLVSIGVYFGVSGAAFGLVGSGWLVDHLGIRGMIIVIATLALVTRYIGIAGVWRYVDRRQPPATISFRDGLRATLRNTQFLAFLPTFVFFQTGLQMLTGVLPFYVRAVLRIENEGMVGRWVAILTGVGIVAIFAAIPVFLRIARRSSKRHAYSLAMLGTGLAFPVLFVAGFLPVIPPRVQIFAAMLMIGAPLAGVYLFPAALTADIADHDETQTGMRREGTYFGTQNFVEKATGALSPLVLGGLMMLGNTAENPLGIRLVGPVAALFVLLGYVLFRSYKLPDQVQRPARAEHPG